MVVQDFLHRSAARNRDKVALVCDGRRLTYGDIDRAANRLANAMIRHGVRRGDRVALMLHNSVEAVVSLFAVLKAGAVFVFIDRATNPDRITFILNNCRATGVVCDAHRRAIVKTIAGRVPSLRFTVLAGGSPVEPETWPHPVLSFDAAQAEFPCDLPPQIDVDVDLACLIYTSGTTGNPKGVMCDHSSMVFASTSVTTYLENVEDDVILNVLPISYSYGLYQILMTFQVGGRLVLEPSFAYPAGVVARMQAEHVTGFAGIPAIYTMLLQMDVRQCDLPSLRYLTNAAAALPVSHVRELRRKLPATRLYLMYGLTETKRALYLPPDQVDRRPGSVGIAIPGTEVWIENDEGRLGPGAVGELVVRGRHVMRGYWEASEATAARFRSGPIAGERVCHTGDLFSMDEDGYFYFVARKDDLIKVQGRKIAPADIERVLCSVEGVIEAAVIGVPDDDLGEIVKAFIVLDGIPITEQQLIQHCRAHLDEYMIPKIFEFRNELPKTGSGKIRRSALASETVPA
jgi:amino acid adenylation domain-containing protein